MDEFDSSNVQVEDLLFDTMCSRWNEVTGACIGLQACYGGGAGVRGGRAGGTGQTVDCRQGADWDEGVQFRVLDVMFWMW